MVVEDIAIGAGALGFDSRTGQTLDIVSPTARHHCIVSWKLHRPGVKPQKWALLHDAV